MEQNPKRQHRQGNDSWCLLVAEPQYEWFEGGIGPLRATRRSATLLHVHMYVFFVLLQASEIKAFIAANDNSPHT